MNNDELKNLQNEQNKEVNIFKRGFIWRPVPRIETTVACFSVIGIVFVVIGVVLLVYSKDIKEVEIRYDHLDDCQTALKFNKENPYADNPKTCKVNMEVKETIKKPVMFYIQLDNFYQNHRRYIKSYSAKQLKGNEVKEKDIKDDCDPIINIKDLGRNLNLNKEILEDDAIANPCGLIARSYFNDTFELFEGDESGNEILISDKGIAWESDKKGRYKRSPNHLKTQWIDVESERFMVWMRPAGLPNFRKLWGKIEDRDLEAGKYVMVITNHYPVESFKGKKSFVFMNVNKFGGDNKFLGITYLIVGGVSIIFAITFIVAHCVFNYKDSYEKKQK